MKGGAALQVDLMKSDEQGGLSISIVFGEVELAMHGAARRETYNCVIMST